MEVGEVNEELDPFEMRALHLGRTLNAPPVTFPGRALLGSLLVMAPSPVLGIAASAGLSLFGITGAIPQTGADPQGPIPRGHQRQWRSGTRDYLFQSLRRGAGRWPT